MIGPIVHWTDSTSPYNVTTTFAMPTILSAPPIRSIAIGFINFSMKMLTNIYF